MNIKKYTIFLTAILMFGNTESLFSADPLKPQPRHIPFKPIGRGDQSYYNDFAHDILSNQNNPFVKDPNNLKNNLRTLFPPNKKIHWAKGANTLRKDSPLANKLTPYGKTPLLYGLVNIGDVNGVTQALKNSNNINPNIRALDGLSGVHLAIKTQSPKMVKVLLSDNRVNIFEQTTCNKEVIKKKLFARDRNSHQHAPNCYQSNLDIAFEREALNRKNQSLRERKHIDDIIYNVIKCYHDTGKEGQEELVRWRDEDDNNILYRCAQGMLYNSAELILSLNDQPNEAPQHYAAYIKAIVDQFSNYNQPNISQNYKQRYLETLSTFLKNNFIRSAVQDLRNNTPEHFIFKRLCKAVRRALRSLTEQNITLQRSKFTDKVLHKITSFRNSLWVLIKDGRTLENRNYETYCQKQSNEGKYNPLGYDIYTIENDWI